MAKKLKNKNKVQSDSDTADDLTPPPTPAKDGYEEEDMEHVLVDEPIPELGKDSTDPVWKPSLERSRKQFCPMK